jgi:hypothetical protein
VPSIDLPRLTPGHEPTRATLHAYARAVGVIPRAHGIAHPRWWHVSLEVRPGALATAPIPLPGRGTLALTMDLRRHEIVVRCGDGGEDRFDMKAGMSGSEMGDALVGAVAEHGLRGPFDRERFADDTPREYDEAAAADLSDAFGGAAIAFEMHRVALGDRVGPIQVWPHGFDLAFEWFGTKRVGEGDEAGTAQLNLGFYPGGEPYFYSNPWPFEESLMSIPLPHGARWTTEGFEGSILPYSAVQGDRNAGAKIVEYARAVYEAAAPTLESG